MFRFPYNFFDQVDSLEEMGHKESKELKTSPAVASRTRKPVIEKVELPSPKPTAVELVVPPSTAVEPAAWATTRPNESAKESDKPTARAKKENTTPTLLTQSLKESAISTGLVELPKEKAKESDAPSLPTEPVESVKKDAVPPLLTDSTEESGTASVSTENAKESDSQTVLTENARESDSQTVLTEPAEECSVSSVPAESDTESDLADDEGTENPELEVAPPEPDTMQFTFCIKVPVSAEEIQRRSRWDKEKRRQFLQFFRAWKSLRRPPVRRRRHPTVAPQSKPVTRTATVQPALGLTQSINSLFNAFYVKVVKVFLVPFMFTLSFLPSPSTILGRAGQRLTLPETD